jgi:hypothetical protein
MIANDEKIDKKFLVEMFYNFELPLSIDEFMEPVGKKDSIVYNDFCLLFKSKKFMGIGKMKTMENELFPVTITKFNKINK